MNWFSRLKADKTPPVAKELTPFEKMTKELDDLEQGWRDLIHIMHAKSGTLDELEQWRIDHLDPYIQKVDTFVTNWPGFTAQPPAREDQPPFPGQFGQRIKRFVEEIKKVRGKVTENLENAIAILT